MKDKRVVIVVDGQSAWCSVCNRMAGLGDAKHIITQPGYGGVYGGYGNEDRGGCGKRFTHVAVTNKAATPKHVLFVASVYPRLPFLGAGEVVRDGEGWRFMLFRRAKDILYSKSKRR